MRKAFLYHDAICTAYPVQIIRSFVLFRYVFYLFLCMCGSMVMIHPYSSGLLHWHWGSASEATLKNMGKINQYKTTIRHNNAWTVIMVCGMYHVAFNSLTPGKFEWNFRCVIFKWILVIDGWGISCEIALIWMSLDFTDDQSTLVQVMAWCHQATSHYLSQCWPRSLLPYGVTRPQRVIISPWTKWLSFWQTTFSNAFSWISVAVNYRYKSI